MRKTIAWALALLLAASLLSGCGSSGGQEAAETSGEASGDVVTIQVNIEGMGQLAAAEPGEELEFDEEFPAQSIFRNVAPGTELTLAARPDEGYKLVRWTLDGQEVSREEQITVTAEADGEYIAVFGPVGTSDEPVDLAAAETMGELMGLPDYGVSFNDSRFVFVFEQDGNYYRAFADLPAEVSQALFDLDFSDEAYEAKRAELVDALPITALEDLTAMTPTQEDLDALAGKTGGDLTEEGWTGTGYNLEDNLFYMDYGPFAYEVAFEGEMPDRDALDEDQDQAIRDLTVKAVTCTGLGGGATDPDSAPE